MNAVRNSPATLINADCFDEFPNIRDGSVDLILTDPPYAIDYQSNRRVVKEQFDKIENDNDTSWIKEFASQSFRVLKNNRHLYCFCRYDTHGLFFNAFADAGFSMKRTLVWVKDNHGSGDLTGSYAPRDEWIIFAHKGRRLLQGPRLDNVLFFPKVASSNLKHPTQKPIPLCKILILKSSFEGEVVFDPFMGVGTVGIAALIEKRRFLGIEITDEYFGISKLNIDAIQVF